MTPSARTMTLRRLELILLALLVALAAFVALFPPSGRPSDLDLQVAVRPVESQQGEQRVEATVIWHWRRRPLLAFGPWYDELGFVYDPGRWVMVVNGNGIYSADALMNRYGEPRSLFGRLLASGQDGQQSIDFISRDSAVEAAVFTLRTQYIRNLDSQGGQGWVKAVQGDYPLR